MKLFNIVFISLFLCQMVSLAHANDQTKTPSSAFDFIRNNLTNGTWESEYIRCNNDCTARYKEMGKIYSVNSTDKFCTMSLKQHMDVSPFQLTKTFNFANIDIEKHGTERIIIKGPIKVSNGETKAELWIDAPSMDSANRVATALNYLKQNCSSASPW